MTDVFLMRALNDARQTMKSTFIGILGTILLTSSRLVGQPVPGDASTGRGSHGAPVQSPTAAGAPTEPKENLARFNLNFPGGTPKQLVEAIEKVSIMPLNAIIPGEYADTQLPPLKMQSVTVAELFASLSAASGKRVAPPAGYAKSPGYTESYGFETQQPIRNNSVWYFFYHKAPIPSQTPITCRFYQLAPYLDIYKVEDITTAIQTGWKMLGETNAPTISYHKDTKLLIAVGDPGRLELIESVLQQLAPATPKPAPAVIPAATSGATAKP